MLEYSKGTVFNAEANALVNTVNCDGVMGAGIALEFKLRYPEMFEDYRDKCSKHLITTGHVDYYQGCDNTIVNFPTKNHWRYPSKMDWIIDGLKDFARTYKDYGIKSVAFPKLGTSNGGLNWPDVKAVMEQYLSDLDIRVVICTDTLRTAAGKEQEMLNILNLISYDEFINNLKLKPTQIEAIKNAVPYTRFWHLGKTKSIGKTAYKKIFDYCYKDNRAVQLHL